MKKYLVFSAAITLFIVFNFFNFSSFDNTLTEAKLIRETFHKGLDQLKVTIDQYQRLAHSITNADADIKNLEQQHLKTREAFKRIEYLLAYLDGESITMFINGAPLPKVEPSVPEVRIVEPKGLQVLDELIFSDHPFESIEAIQKQTDQLVYNFKHVDAYQRGISIDHRQIFEAIRQELVRIITLGVTGFDTPGGSQNAIQEAKVAMESIAKATEVYLPKIKMKKPELAVATEQTFKKAIQFLEANPDFDSFDRLSFLKTYINPLYEFTYQCHRSLGIETTEEVNSIPQPLNYHATNLFSTDFYNLDYYARTDFSNPNISAIVALGKTLFFDPILSSNNQGACATCHDPQKAFTDGLPKSRSLLENKSLQRNTPTVLNVVFAEKFFYDVRENMIDRQIKHVVKDQQEFATDFVEIIDKLNQSREYKTLFDEYYPGIGITPHSISNALAVYIASLNSYNSPFDKYVRNELEEIDESVKRGFNLFMGKAACGTCHFAPNFNGTVPPLYRESESEVLGVPTNKDTLNAVLDPDPGRAMNLVPRDEAPFYMHSFKTTTVRNAALTAPYMHNGVYDSLEEVIDFYNRGGGAGLGLDLEYQTLPDSPLNLSPQEQKDLIAFMEALTDTTHLSSPPLNLPKFENNPELDTRIIGGSY